jgi:hypothetical protein
VRNENPRHGGFRHPRASGRATTADPPSPRRPNDAERNGKHPELNARFPPKATHRARAEN